jgi:hypothetical protein
VRVPAAGGEVPSGATGSPDWWAILGDLDARRASILAERDLAGLGDIAVPGSPAWRADAAVIGDLLARDLRPEGLSTQVVAVEDVALGAGEARVVLVDDRAGYRLLDASGTVVQEVDSPGRRRWLVVLARQGADTGAQGWRISRVEASS